MRYPNNFSINQLNRSYISDPVLTKDISPKKFPNEEVKMIESPHQVQIPHTDVVSFVFSSGTPSKRESPQYFDAESPSKCYSLAQAELWVKQFAKGLQTIGLQPGDKVLFYSSNHLYFPVLLWGVLAARCVFTAASPTASEGGK